METPNPKDAGRFSNSPSNPVLQFAEPRLEGRRTPSRVITIPYARDVLGATIIVVGRYGIDRRGTERVEASVQGRYMHRSLGNRLWRGIVPESNLFPPGENFVENVVFITHLDKSIVAAKIASGEIVVVP